MKATTHPDPNEKRRDTTQEDFVGPVAAGNAKIKDRKTEYPAPSPEKLPGREHVCMQLTGPDAMRLGHRSTQAGEEA